MIDKSLMIFSGIGPRYYPYIQALQAWIDKADAPFVVCEDDIVTIDFTIWGAYLKAMPVNGVMQSWQFYADWIDKYLLENPAKPHKCLWRNHTEGNKKVWIEGCKGWDGLQDAPPTHRICVSCNKKEAVSDYA